MRTSLKIAVVAGILLVLGGVVLFTRRANDFATLGDTAVIESYTWMAARGQLLVGPYSRFQWHHPGPLYFYWMAPFYALAGSRPAGLNLGAVTLNLAALASVAFIVRKQAGSMLASGILIAILVYAWRIAPVFTSAWNPHIPVFALVALIVAAADTLSGRVSTLPVVVLLASLIAQTHVALVPTTLMLGFCALTGAIVVTRSDRLHARSHRRWLLASGAALIVVWSVPVLEQVQGRPGNLGQLWTFFILESHPGQRFATAFAAWSEMLTGVIRPGFATAEGIVFRPGPRWVGTLAAIEVAGVVAAAVLAIRARRRFEAALALLLALSSLVALWSATRIEEAIFDYEVFWISGIGVLNIALLGSIASGLLLSARLQSAMTADPVNVTIWCTLSVACLVPPAGYMRSAIVSSSLVPPASRIVSMVADELHRYFDREHIVRPLVRIDQDAWPLAAGVILQLQKQGVPVAVEDDWVPMFTAQFAATGDELVELAIYGKPQHVRSMGKPGDSVIFEHDPIIFVHRLERQ